MKNTSYPRTDPNALQSRGLAFGLSLWIVTITIGIAVFSELQMFSALIDEGPFTLLSVSVLGAMVGGVVGAGVVLAQRLAPLHPIARTQAWILATIGAWALAGALYELLYRITIPFDDALSWPIMGAGVGLGFGVGHGLAARHHASNLQLLLLVLANVIGWSAGLTIARFVYQFNSGTALGYVVSIAVAGILAGLITGITLSKLATPAPRGIAES